MQKQRTELAHASRLAVAGELTASIAHEINQPLGAIQTSADAADLILQAGGDRRDDLLRIVTRIRRDNLRASDVIRRLRALFAKHEPERQPLDLNAAIGRCRDVAARGSPAAGGDPRPSARVDTDRTSSATRPKSSRCSSSWCSTRWMRWLTCPRIGARSSCRSRRIASDISITVRDRGHGIAPEHLPKLFDSFFSTKQRGMGLGLSIARTIVEAHGGRIWAENGAGDGAVFHVELPAVDEASVPVSGRDMSATALIHVVDDDESLRTALLELLDAAGFEARGYASTGEFLLHPLPDRPGCVLLDVRMPGPSGLDLQAALQRQGIALPVIFLTGHADVPTSVRAMKAGAVDFLEKPVERDTLLDALRRALARDAAQRAAREEALRQSARLAVLTPREREVFDRIVAGKLNKQIADELGIGLRTVKAYRAQLMEKLGVTSAAELGRLAGELRDASLAAPPSASAHPALWCNDVAPSATFRGAASARPFAANSPVRRSISRSMQATRRFAMAMGAGRRVLVVEDDDGMREAIETLAGRGRHSSPRRTRRRRRCWPEAPSTAPCASSAISSCPRCRASSC